MRAPGWEVSPGQAASTMNVGLLAVVESRQVLDWLMQSPKMTCLT